MDLNTVNHLLSTTRTVRKRLDFDRSVEPAVIQECLDLAIQAPSGSNSQGWRFVVITDAEKRAVIAGYYRDQFRKYIRSRTDRAGIWTPMIRVPCAHPRLPVPPSICPPTCTKPLC